MKISSILSADAHWNVNKKLSRQIGLVPTVLFMELVFCCEKYEQDEIYESAEKLEKILGVGPDARRSATKVLLDHNYIQVIKKGQPARNFYKINHEVVLAFLCGLPSTSDQGDGTTGDTEPDTTSDQGDGTTLSKNINKNKETKNIPPNDDDEKPDYQWLTEFLIRFYRDELKSISTPRIFTLTIEHFLKIPNLSKEIFELKCLAYKNDPYRAEKKIPFSPEGLLKAWNYINIDPVSPPSTPQEKVEAMIDSRPKSEKLISYLDRFPKATKEALSKHLYVDSDDNVQMLPGIDPTHLDKAKQIITILNG